MSKQTKTNEPKAKKNINVKGKVAGLYSLVLALAELATVYIFATQDNKALWVLAGVLGLDATIRLTSKFVK